LSDCQALALLPQNSRLQHKTRMSVKNVGVLCIKKNHFNCKACSFLTQM
jgi:hypothetical protein